MKWGNSASISADGKYRYSLTRCWNSALPMCCWICLNPSTADEHKDDPTVRKIVGFSARLLYGGFHLFNLFAFRATTPRDMYRAVDPIGPDNSPIWIAAETRILSPDPVIVAWGSLRNTFRPRASAVLSELSNPRCLGTTATGDPRHPLMIAYSTVLRPFGESGKKGCGEETKWFRPRDCGQ
jgi:hypothetical protein